MTVSAERITNIASYAGADIAAVLGDEGLNKLGEAAMMVYNNAKTVVRCDDPHLIPLVTGALQRLVLARAIYEGATRHLVVIDFAHEQGPYWLDFLKGALSEDPTRPGINLNEARKHDTRLIVLNAHEGVPVLNQLQAYFREGLGGCVILPLGYNHHWPEPLKHLCGEVMTWSHDVYVST